MTTLERSSVRLGRGPLSVRTTGLSVGVALVVFAALYAVSVVLWTWILMLVLGAAGVDWGYTRCLLPWGFLMPCLGFLLRSSRRST